MANSATGNLRKHSFSDEDHPAFVSVERAGRLLNVSRTTVYKLLSSNGGPLQTVKIGKSRKVVWESLTDYLKALVAEALEVEKGPGNIPDNPSLGEIDSTTRCRFGVALPGDERPEGYRKQEKE